MVETLRFKSKNMQKYLFGKGINWSAMNSMIFGILLALLILFLMGEDVVLALILLLLVFILMLPVIWYFIYVVKESEYKIDENSLIVYKMPVIWLRNVARIEKTNVGGTPTLVLHYDQFLSKLFMQDNMAVFLPEKDTAKIEKQIIERVKRNNPNVTFVKAPSV